VSPEQQPPGQETPSQTQPPFWQCCPGAQAPPPPQAHPPAAEQPSAVTRLQAMQDAPPVPQAASEGALQVAPAQQPLGHDVPSQMQFPPWQRWPDPHMAPPPQVQAPDAEQLSALVVSQPTQAAPPVPQVSTAGGLQVAPEQQPFGQLVALQPLQRPAVQVWPPGQGWQAPPPAPHAAGSSPA
jgi:hypothetical protein